MMPVSSSFPNKVILVALDDQRRSLEQLPVHSTISISISRLYLDHDTPTHAVSKWRCQDWHKGCDNTIIVDKKPLVQTSASIPIAPPTLISSRRLAI